MRSCSCIFDSYKRTYLHTHSCEALPVCVLALQHNSVAVPELLAAAAEALKGFAADAHECRAREAAARRAAERSDSAITSGRNGAARSLNSGGGLGTQGGGAEGASAIPLAATASLLRSFTALNHHPGPLAVSCLVAEAALELSSAVGASNLEAGAQEGEHAAATAAATQRGNGRAAVATDAAPGCNLQLQHVAGFLRGLAELSYLPAPTVLQVGGGKTCMHCTVTIPTWQHVLVMQVLQTLLLLLLTVAGCVTASKRRIHCLPRRTH